MNPLKKLVNRFIGSPKAGANYVGAPSFRQVNPYGFFDFCETDSYASAYPSIRAIANEYMSIKPSAIDANGKPIQNNNIVNALYHPNKIDSSVAFFEKMAVSTLVLPKTYLLVWRNEGGDAKPGGNFGPRGRNIAGFTFLEQPAITIRDGRTFYTMGSQEFNDMEVMVLTGGVDPYNLYGGYAPMLAAKKWATLDDYIADFQRGFFENNAIPAGHFIITAASNDDYKDTVKRMKEKHQGVGNNNNVTYTPRPMGQDGKPTDAKIEWIPFAQSNKDIGFKELFEQANKRLDLAFGVPQIIKGVDDAATYANAQVAEKTFAQRAVYPLALRNYTQITHELNRITGGIGIAITFDYEIPTVADEEKVNAETKNIEANLIRTLTIEGYSLESIVNAFELSNGYKKLSKTTTPAVIENDKPDVDEGDEVDNAPDPTKIDGVTPLNRGSEDKRPKAELTDKERIEAVARQFMREQVDRAVSELKNDPVALEEPTESELDEFVQSMMTIVTAILVANGQDEYAAAVVLAGLSLEELQGFTLSDAAEDAYRAYLRRVGTSYGTDTAESIRKVLYDAAENGLNRREMEANLRSIMSADDWRVERLARTELNNSQNVGKLEGVKSLSAEVGGTWEKTIDHSGVTPCPLCASQEGVWTALDQPLWALGESIISQNEEGEQTVYVNDWQSDEANDYHPNGRGALVFRRAS